MSYDDNGNITNLQRMGKTGPSYGLMDNLNYIYSGNRLAAVNDAINGNHEIDFVKRGSGGYTYYANGNLKSDANEQISNITYNTYLNQPTEVLLTDGRKIRMNYDGSGALLTTSYYNSADSLIENWSYVAGTVLKNGQFYQNDSPVGRLVYQDSVWKYEFYYKDYQGNIRLSFKAEGNQLVKTAETHFDPWGVILNGVGKQNNFSNRFEFQGKESEKTFGLNRIQFGARTYNPTIGRFDRIDPKADKFSAFSPYVFGLNNLLRYIDPDGAAPLDIFKQTKDGGYVKVSNQGGSRNHTYINNNGTTSYYNVQTGTMRTVSNQGMQGKLEQYRAEKQGRIETTLKVLDVADKVGDGLSVAGTVAAPFTEGASLSITAVGEGISLGATAAKHAINLSTEGVTTENIIDFAVDAAFEAIPGFVDDAVKRTNLDDVSKKIIRAEIKQGTMVTEKMVTGTIEKSREKDE